MQAVPVGRKFVGIDFWDAGPVVARGGHLRVLGPWTWVASLLLPLFRGLKYPLREVGDSGSTEGEWMGAGWGS